GDRTAHAGDVHEARAAGGGDEAAGGGGTVVGACHGNKTAVVNFGADVEDAQNAVGSGRDPFLGYHRAGAAGLRADQNQILRGGLVGAGACDPPVTGGAGQRAVERGEAGAATAGYE